MPHNEHSHPDSNEPLPAILRDPVCGMTVAGDSLHRLTHEGQEYLFCSRGCRDKFAAQPELYLNKVNSSKSA